MRIFLILIAGAVTVAAADFKPMAQDSIVAKGAKTELVWAGGKFTEGPTLGPKGVIFFSDIGMRTMRFDPASGKTTVFREPSGKANGLMMDRKGNLIACEGAHGGGRRVSLTTLQGKTRTVVDRWQGKRFNSPNDLAIDAKNRIYFTDPRYGGGDDRELDFEGVFLITGKKVKLATKEISRPNGILVSLDGKKVFVADNHSDAKGNHHLVQFDVQKDGTLTNKKILFDIGPDRRGIDGMTLDEMGTFTPPPVVVSCPASTCFRPPASSWPSFPPATRRPIASSAVARRRAHFTSPPVASSWKIVGACIAFH